MAAGRTASSTNLESEAMHQCAYDNFLADKAEAFNSSALLPLAVGKSLFLDIATKLTAAGLSAEQIPARLEGMAFGADVMIDGVVKHTLYIGNDNDFLAVTPGGKTDPNQWFVFAFTAVDLGGSAFVNRQWTGAAGAAAKR